MPKLRSIPLDFYRLRAAEMFHTTYAQVTAAEREVVKRILWVYEYGGPINQEELRNMLLVIYDNTIKTLN